MEGKDNRQTQLYTIEVSKYLNILKLTVHIIIFSDEQNCNLPCPESDFKCRSSGRYILSSWSCDSEADCSGKSFVTNCFPIKL